jgi:predicted TIM-barrel fold metal-dependent hydrolase
MKTAVKTPLIDVDLHHTWASDEAIAAYMPAAWQPYFTGGSPHAPFPGYGRAHPPHLRFPVVAGSGLRPEAVPPGGGTPGSHYETLRDQHLDPSGVSRALLTWQYGLHPALLNPDASVALCRAANDFLIDYWLGQGDERLYAAMCVPPASPDEAVREIERIGGHPHVIAVLMAANPFSKPLGHPVYHPILAAAAEAGLPVVTHVGSDSINKGSWHAGGLPGSMLEYFTVLDQPAAHHLSSLLVGGVFDKLPDLRILFNESGFTWVPWLVWALDAGYAELRVEQPSLERLPSEYFHDHVWLSTQPFVGDGRVSPMIEMLEIFGGMENRLCYASDYPHWDSDLPKAVLSRLPPAWRPKVAYENSARLFGWTAEFLEPEAEATVVSRS